MSESKIVTFSNVKFNNGKAQPWQWSGYRHPKLGLIRFADIRLRDREGKYYKVKNDDGKEVFATWGQSLDLSGKRTISLDPVTHEDVITAIRDWSQCRSSKKSDDVRLRQNSKGELVERKFGLGWLKENEPDVEMQKEAEESDQRMLAIVKCNQLLNDGNDYNRKLVAMAMGVYDSRDRSFRTMLQQHAEKQPKEFLETFASEDSLELTEADRIQTVIKLAVRDSVITLNKGIYFFQDSSLGANMSRIHTEHNDKMNAIEHELKTKYKVESAPSAKIKEDNTSNKQDE